MHTKENLGEVQGVISKYLDSPAHTKSCVSKPIKKWPSTGSVRDKTRHLKKTVPTDEKLEDVLAQLQVSPRKISKTIITRQVCP
jgi:hypothetical protein